MRDVEQPLERLNYFNGQRLEASDFRVEQEFHVRVRRWLNRSLYTTGIAAGLEVTIKEDDPHKVVVSRGMALDSEGQEIILLTAREVQVVGKPSQIEGVVSGNYLVIQYAEEKVAPLADGCAIPLKNKKGSKVAWGGPSRIRAEPVIKWQNNWPAEGSGQIVLAQAELDENCAVAAIRTTVRKYVGEAKAETVRTLTLEGEKDIDDTDAKVIYFHIEGGFPNNVLLYLRGALFSTLYYTEMGSHSHVINLNIDPHSEDLKHHHSITEGETGPGSPHNHKLWVDDAAGAGGLEATPGEGFNEGDNLMSKESNHTHSFGGSDTDERLSVLNFTHNSATATADATGTPDKEVRSGSTRKYVRDLQVDFDDHNVTDLIVAQLRDRDGANTWQMLGDGTKNHDLVTRGTQAIDLIRLGVDLSPGEHSIKLSVETGGGKIQYNLYLD